MPRIIEQPEDLGLVPKLNDANEARRKLRMGVNKWNTEQHRIDCVVIGKRRFWTDAALAAYARRSTQKASAA